MPAPEEVAQRVLSQHWSGVSSFFERAERELSAPGLGFRSAFASVPRRLAKAAESCPGVPPDLPAARAHWTLTEYARLWLIARALPHLTAGAQPSFLLKLFESGELREQISILRVLAALPDPGRFVEVGLQACRTNARDVLEAIVCENAFLADHFAPLNFNQAIMKAIFMGVPLGRVEQLERRVTAELARMAAAYASERRAAGRDVPKDADDLSSYRG